MRNRTGGQGIGVLVALVVVGSVVAACGRDAVEGRELALAGGEPVPVLAAGPVVPVDTSSPSDPTRAAAPAARPAAVTYAEAEAAFRSGRPADAAELFAAYVATRPGNAHGHYMHGLSSWRAGDPDMAGRALLRAVELDGTNVRARTNLARVLLEQRRPEEAVVQLEAVLEFDMSVHEVWRVLGNAYSQLGRAEDAMDAYREALVLNGDDAWSMNNYGLLLIQLSRFDDAVLPLARAVELKPGSAIFQNNFGVALERIGALAQAEQAFAAALVADSGHARARDSLARVRARLEGAQPHPTVDVSGFAPGFVEQVSRWREGLDREDCQH
jgi:predicted Zn-dependent protease